MCDELTQADNDRLLMTRREFGAGAAATGALAILPVPANAAETKGRDVTIVTPDGSCDAYFVAPATGKHPAVLVWPDIFGLRPAFRQMADRLAQSGYAVLTVNQFYRSTKTPFVSPGQGFDDALKAKVGPWRAALTPDATMRDAKAFVAWLDGANHQVFHRIAEKLRLGMHDTRREENCLAGAHSMGRAVKREFALSFKHIDRLFGVVRVLVPQPSRALRNSVRCTCNRFAPFIDPTTGS